MRVPIKMIVENAQKGEQVEFSGTVKKVYDFKDKKTKWSIGNQTMVIKDDTGEINTVVNIRNDHQIYGKDIEGKEVVVSGTASEWEGKKKVFGKKLSFTEDWQDEDKPQKAKAGNQKQTTNLTPEKIKIESLVIAEKLIQHLDMKFKDAQEEWQVINVLANECVKYITGNKIEGAVNTPDEAVDKAKELSEKKEEDPDLAEKVKKINYIMEMAEDNGEEARDYIDDFVKKCKAKNIKELTLKQLETLEKKMETFVPSEDNIPF